MNQKLAELDVEIDQLYAELAQLRRKPDPEREQEIRDEIRWLQQQAADLIPEYQPLLETEYQRKV